LQAGVRNQLTGKVTEITTGNIMSQVAVKVGDYEITSVMTKESLIDAGFKEGDTVTALIKAVNVVLVK
jgi:molybdate transport system regulatory protein